MGFYKISAYLFIVCMMSACYSVDSVSDGSNTNSSNIPGDTVLGDTSDLTVNADDAVATEVIADTEDSCREPALPAELDCFEGGDIDNNCAVDDDCAVGGQGADVCAAASADMVTTCEWTGPPREDIPCHCGCVDNSCVWYIERCKQPDDANGQWFAVTVEGKNIDCEGGWNVQFADDNLDQVATLLDSGGFGTYVAYHLPEAYQQPGLSIEVRIAKQKSSWWCTALGPGYEHLVVVEARLESR
jgi:hypothetical protein